MEIRGAYWHIMAEDTNKSENRFRSRSEHNVDAKGRLNIPSRFRDVLRCEYSETLMITNWDKCLKAYPVQVWDDLESTLLSEGKKQPGMASFVRYVISGVTECPLDRQGRILIPPTLRTELDIQKEVILSGMLDHFEIWNKLAWDAETKQTRGQFENYNLSALGIL